MVPFTLVSSAGKSLSKEAAQEGRDPGGADLPAGTAGGSLDCVCRAATPRPPGKAGQGILRWGFFSLNCQPGKEKRPPGYGFLGGQSQIGVGEHLSPSILGGSYARSSAPISSGEPRCPHPTRVVGTYPSPPAGPGVWPRMSQPRSWAPGTHAAPGLPAQGGWPLTFMWGQLPEEDANSKGSRTKS